VYTCYLKEDKSHLTVQCVMKKMDNMDACMCETKEAYCLYAHVQTAVELACPCVVKKALSKDLKSYMI